VCAAAVFAGAAGHAASEEWTPLRSFRSFSRASFRELPQSSVIALAQDSSGVLWMGTLDGVASFDGRSITPVPNTAGAPARGIITGILAGHEGAVYVGAAPGVYIFDGRSWRLAATRRQAVALAETPDGALWMADVDGALWMLATPLSPARQGWQRRSDVGDPAVALFASNDGAVWIATPSRVLRLRGRAVEPVAGGAELPSRPGGLLVDREGRCWVATSGGTVHWAMPGDTAWQRAELPGWPGGAFRTLAEDRRGRIWAGSYAGRVAFGTAERPWTVWDRRNGPFGAGVMAVLGDREGNVWFGLNANGLAQWIGEAWSHRNAVDPAEPSAVRTAAFGLSRTHDGRGVLIAHFINGAERIHEKGSRNFDDPDGLTEDVRAIVEPEPGTLWAGTRFGLFESRGGGRFRQVLKLPSGFVMGFFKSPRGAWHAGTSSQGVLVHERGEWRPVPAINAALDDPHVRNMTWLRNGELWVATLRGISVFREGAAPLRLTAATVAALPSSVNALLESASGDVWAGGTGGIAVRSGGAWRKLTEADGIPGHTIYSLGLAKGGEVWAGGSAGVGRHAQGRWTVWDSRGGLLDEECNLNGLLVNDDGSVYVGTMGGLARFDPTVGALSAPPLLLAWRDAPARDAQGVARVSDRALHLRWSAPWLGPRPVEYRVRVPRLREGWSAPTRDDRIDIENLAPGPWHVEVAARVDGSAAWSEPLQLLVHVAPFWHETLAARLAALAVVGLAVAGGVRLRLRALRRHAATLEATVRERTAELAEKVELLQASEHRAQEASRAKSVFLANMSHELRTPLNGVLGFAQLMGRRAGRDDEDRRHLTIIQRSGEHLLGLINEVLSLSRIEAGRASLQEAPFDLRAMLDDLVEMLRARAEAKALSLNCEIEGGLPAAVNGDLGKLRQILLNLLGNAVKFTAKGKVTLRAAWTDGVGRFDVQDTGPGIAAAEAERIFEPFVQTEVGRRAREGTGLGLGLARELARLMGGDITVDGAVGRGARFRVQVRLPAADAAALASRQPGRVLRLAPGQPAWRILVVDDVKHNRDLLRGLIESVGYDVREAATGEEAVALWRRFEPHLIWMDKRMPGVDGLEATRRIREESARAGGPPVKIIAHSASALSHERSEILASGCDDFVAKPFQEATIFAKMAEHLGARYEYEVDRPSEPAADTPAAPRGASLRVLLVDDSQVNREVARSLLERLGLGVTEAPGGAHALARLETERFDAVLLDIEMPNVDGITTVKALRGRPALRELPVIAMTAHDAQDREHFVAAGMSDYVGKPIREDELRRVLGRFLPLAPLPAPDSAAAAPAAAGPELPARVPGLDVAEGLWRVSGNAVLYRTVVSDFASSWKDGSQRLAELLSRAAVTDAVRLAHTLKGTAATIGARRVAAAAASLETELRSGAASASAVAELAQALQELESGAAQLARADGRSAAPGGIPGDVASRALPLARRFSELLASDDLAALQAFERLKAALGSAAPSLARLDACLERLDFASAKECAGPLLALLGQAAEQGQPATGEAATRSSQV
jgi:signal transduction histidine kinase/DNA-binding response OmpR family regulator/ligand-binding sensor domain-containing protein/HPt (histidine-containing phosphotransfer) domain-containing protein